ncbi:MAG: hypothetical protein EOP56_01520 [Sphingobacteriales bacterium]|nr:MAG: hypothetical protein EOP56_01520 [Sphingobacteriales bacterium]
MRDEQFEKNLDEDLAWRKKEISELMLIAKSESEKTVILKSLILLLYAHWEGYIKKSSKLYIKYVSEKKLKTSDLCVNFKAIVLKQHVSRCIENKESLSLVNELDFIDKYLKYQDLKFKINVKIDGDQDNSIIDTESNLKPKVFKKILSILGLNYKNALSTREHYINSNLLLNRNSIGHGSDFDSSKQQEFDLKLKDIEKLRSIVFLIIENFRDELLEYVNREFYLNCKDSERKAFEVAKENHLEQSFKEIEENYKVAATSSL